jgi:type II secretory pathway component PulL
LQNGGLLPLAGAVASAVEAVPGVEVERLVYTGAEGLRVGIRAPNTGDYQILIAKLSASGLTVNEGGTDGAREIVVKRP